MLGEGVTRRVLRSFQASLYVSIDGREYHLYSTHHGKRHVPIP